MVARTRPDIVKKYEGLLGEEKTGLVSDYIFHCNGHTPAGETAFHRLMSGFGWANSPLLPRLDKLDPAGEILTGRWMYILPNAPKQVKLFWRILGDIREN